jgi:hypothetical protein
MNSQNHQSFGGKGIRTPDFQLAKLALYQLSYAPEKELRNVDCGLRIAIALTTKCERAGPAGRTFCRRIEL